MARTRQSLATDLIAELESPLFAALSESVRLQILKLLIAKGRLDIGAIADELPKDRSVISRHLDLMREAGIVTATKEGRHTFYEIDIGFVREKFRAILDRLDRCCG